MGDVTPVAAADAPAAPARRARRVGPPQSFTRTLQDAKGNTLQFVATIKRDGSVSSYVYHRIVDAKGKMTKSERGGTIAYPNIEACKAAFATGVASAVAGGWTERKAGGGAGFQARPDSFDLNSLPKPVNK